MTRLARTSRRTTTWLTFPLVLLAPAYVAALVLLAADVAGFTASSSMRCSFRMGNEPRRSPTRGLPESRLKFLSGVAGGASAVVLPLAVIADPALEKFTKGEICLERNLVGACSKFGVTDAPEEVEAVSKKSAAQEEPESELMSTLKRRTVENKAKNDEEIATKTFTNGQSGEFGPFSRYVPVKHKDTGRYELVLISELDGMKKSGLIVTERGAQDVFADAK